MLMAEKFDVSTLNWVKGEIDETLKQARVSLEAYVDNPSDDAQIRFCVAYLHQVCGTLQMVELFGAAQAAKEMEQLAVALQEQKLKDPQPAYELLMRAILLLPDYLETLQAGQPDTPVLLLPLINDLRTCYGEKALTEAAIFHPDFSVAPPPRGADLPKVNMRALAHKLYPYYHNSLVKISKNIDLANSIKTIATVLEKLLVPSSRHEVRQLLWVTSAYVEGLRGRAIRFDKAAIQLLLKVDQLVKALVSLDEGGIKPEHLQGVSRVLLFQIGKGEPKGARVVAVRRAFQLETLLPSAETVQKSLETMSGFNSGLKKTVSADVMEELSRVKDALDLFVRSDLTATTHLETIATSLERMSHTLSLLRQESLRATINEQIKVVKQLINGALKPDDQTLMGVAAAVLAAESSLKDWGGVVPVEKADDAEEQVSESDHSPQVEAEHRRVIRQVMKEAKDDLVKLREGINTYLENPSDQATLDAMPLRLHQIVGSLSLLSYKRVAQVVRACGFYMVREMSKAGSRTPEKLDALADALMSVEYYLEAFVESRVHPASVLEVAERAVSVLGYPIDRLPDEDLVQTSKTEQGDEEGEDLGLAAEQGAAISDDAASIVTAPTAAIAPVVPQSPVAPPHSPVAPPVEEAVVVEEEALDMGRRSASVTSPPAATPPPPAQEAAEEEDVLDDEIIEIFIEEAEEVLENMGQYLPAWRANQGNDEALGDLRRAYHTLKGSGRLVGAKVIGEFAWAFESMLNRVIDKTVTPSNAMFDLLEQAYEVLPELVTQFKDGTPPKGDYLFLQEAAEDFSKPGGLSMPRGDSEKKSESVAAAGAAATEQKPKPTADNATSEPARTAPAHSTSSEEVPQIDPVLLDIYSKEVESHLGVLDGFIHGCYTQGNCRVEEPVVRALHTLQGSSRMAGVKPVAELSAGLEKYAKGVQVTRALVEPVVLEIMRSYIAYCREELRFLEAPGRGAEPDRSSLARRIDALINGEDLAADFSPEAGLASKPEVESAQPVEVADASDELTLADVTEEESDTDTLETEPVAEEAVEVVAPQGSEPEAVDDMFVYDLDGADDEGEGEEEEEETSVATQVVASVIAEGDASVAHEPAEDELATEVSVASETSTTAAYSAFDALEGLDLEGVEAFLPAADAEEGADVDVSDTTSADDSVDAVESASAEGLDVASADDLAAAWAQDDLPTDPVDETPGGAPQMDLETALDVPAVEQFESGGERIAVDEGFTPSDDDLALFAGLGMSDAAADEASDAVADTSEAVLDAEEGLAEAAVFEVLETSDDEAAIAASVDDESHEVLVVDGYDLPEEPVVEFVPPATASEVSHSEAVVEPGHHHEEVLITEEELDAHKPTALVPPPEPPLPVVGVDIYDSPDFDEDVVDIFLEEGEEILDATESTLQEWLDNPSDHDLVISLQRQLHTLKGGARMAGITPIGDLCHSFETLLGAVADGLVARSHEMTELLQMTHDRLADMLGQVRDRQPITLGDDLVRRVDALARGAEGGPQDEPGETLAGVPDLSMIEVESEGEAEVSLASIGLPGLDLYSAFGHAHPDDDAADALTPEVAQVAQAHDSGAMPELTLELSGVGSDADDLFVLEDVDPDVLEIFLEESEEILDASEETLQTWVNAPDNRELVTILQRQLHTLKGGARMAGIIPVGDLSHSLETLLGNVVDGLLARTPEMLNLLQLTHDRLVQMLDQVRNNEPIVTGGDLIARVNALADGDTSALLEAAATPVAEGPVAPAEPDEAELPQAPKMEMAKFIDEATTKLHEMQAEAKRWPQQKEDRTAAELLSGKVDAMVAVAKQQQVNEFTDLSKSLQSLMQNVLDGHVPVSDEVFRLLQLTAARLEEMLRHLRINAPVPNGRYLVTSIAEHIAVCLKNQEAEQQSAAGGEPAAERQPLAASAAATAREKALEQAANDAQNRRRSSRVQQEVVRVGADMLDNLVSYAGEVSIYRSRVEQQFGSLRFNLNEFDQTIERLRGQLRQFDIETEAQIMSRREEIHVVGVESADFDPLEFDRFTTMQQLSRSMMESLSDLTSIESMIADIARESETLLLQQSRVNTELQEGLMHTRMMPLVENAPRLRRLVRQVSTELGKQVELRFQGAEVEMDRNAVNRIMAPLEHLLRNAIGHGLESPEARRQLGKPEVGVINIAQSRERSEIVIRISDDGAGINLDKVRKKAIERGLMRPDADLTPKEVMHFILESGFSTAEALTQVSGRGVGMDVVGSEIKQLGGALDIDSVRGKGTTFTIRLPLMMSVSRSLLVNLGEDIYAIPLLSIIGIERIPKFRLREMLKQEGATYRWLNTEFALLDLRTILGEPPDVAEVGDDEKYPLLMAQTGDHSVALAVDGLIGSREVVIKSLGAQLSKVHGLSGATVLADGRVALILDLPSLIRTGLAKRGRVEEVVETQSAAPAKRKREGAATVMVVDDSITVRKVSERMLKRNRFNSVVAKDGVEALAILEEVMPDVMLLDIEMPRMDGYELATHIRNSDRLKHIPIIMITSRTGDKHRQRAMDIGVNVYLGKPFQEADLLEHIRTILAEDEA